MTAALMMAPHQLSDFAACLNCDEAAHSLGTGRTWVHTRTGLFRCTNPHGVSMLTWCEPSSVDARETALSKAYDDGIEYCEEGHDALADGARDDGYATGESEQSAKVEALLAEWEKRFVGDDAVPGQGLICEFIDGVREVLK